MFIFLNVRDRYVNYFKGADKRHEGVKLLPNVRSARVSAQLLAVVVVSPGNPTWAATCCSTAGWSSSSESPVSFCAIAPLSRDLVLTSLLCRCKLAGCTQTFYNAAKLKRHVQCAHGDKGKYFKVCVNVQLCPRDGARATHCNKLHPLKVTAPVVKWPLFDTFVSCMFSLLSATIQTASWPSKNAECLNCT